MTAAATCHIKALHGRIVYDALGYPAVEAQIDTFSDDSASSTFTAIVTNSQLEYAPSSYTARNSSIRPSSQVTKTTTLERASSTRSKSKLQQHSADRLSSARNTVVEDDHSEWISARSMAEAAVDIINTKIRPAILAQQQPRFDCVLQAQIDCFLTAFAEQQQQQPHLLDSLALSTATMAVSMAACRAGAHAQYNMPLYAHLAQLAGTAEPHHFTLPVPHIALLDGGGARAGSRLKSVACRSISLLPIGCASFRHATALGVELFHTLMHTAPKALSKSRTDLHQPYNKHNNSILFSDEGTIVPQKRAMHDILQLLTDHFAAYHQQCQPLPAAYKLSLHIDADSFYNADNSKYHLESSIKPPSPTTANTPNDTPAPPPSTKLSADEMFSHMRDLLRVYPVMSLVDAFSVRDLQAWKNAVMEVNITLPSTLQLVADRFIASQPLNVNQFVVLNRYCNAALFRLNQVATVTELIQLVQMMRLYGVVPVAAQARHESEDTFICDVAVGFACPQVKLGAPVRGENIAKYNRLMAIEDELLREDSKFTCDYAGAKHSHII